MREPAPSPRDTSINPRAPAADFSTGDSGGLPLLPIALAAVGVAIAVAFYFMQQAAGGGDDDGPIKLSRN